MGTRPAALYGLTGAACGVSGSRQKLWRTRQSPFEEAGTSNFSLLRQFVTQFSERHILNANLRPLPQGNCHAVLVNYLSEEPLLDFKK